jgi:hypothetical protein
MAKEKQVPAAREASPAVMQQLRQAVFQLSQSSIWEKIRQTTFSGTLISISSLITMKVAPNRNGKYLKTGLYRPRTHDSVSRLGSWVAERSSLI